MWRWRTDGWSLWLCHIMLSALGQAMADRRPTSSTLCSLMWGGCHPHPHYAEWEQRPLPTQSPEQREGPSASLGTAGTPMGVAVGMGEGEKQEKSGRPPQRGLSAVDAAAPGWLPWGLRRSTFFGPPSESRSGDEDRLGHHALSCSWAGDWIAQTVGGGLWVATAAVPD